MTRSFKVSPLSQTTQEKNTKTKKILIFVFQSDIFTKKKNINKTKQNINTTQS